MDRHRATLKFKSLRTNLANLPLPICNLLYNANITIQDVIVEIESSSSITKLYCGWSGMSLSSIDNFELDPIFARSLNLSEGDKLILNLKLDNYEATNINLEPESSSDWELVELHAQTLEDKLLSQSRCVSVGQTLVVYPSQTSSARLVVTDIGSPTHKYAKISPSCEVAIAPKVRTKTTAKKHSRTVKSSSKEDYSTLPTVLKRGISMPHQLFNGAIEENATFAVYVNLQEIPRFLRDWSYVAVSVIPGPLTKIAPLEKSTPGPLGKDKESKEKSKLAALQAIKENRRVVAKLVPYKNCPTSSVGLSEALSIALGCDGQNGNIVVLQQSMAPGKAPSTIQIHPFITQTKKNASINVVSQSKKDRDIKLASIISKALSLSGPVTNFTKIPVIPNVLPSGGLLKFKRSDDHNNWFLAKDVQFKYEMVEDLLRTESFIQETPTSSSEKIGLSAVGSEKTISDIAHIASSTRNAGLLLYGNSGSGKTLLLKIVSQKMADQYAFHVKTVNCEAIMNENFSLLSNNHILKWLQECTWHKPSLLVLDNVDKIFAAEVENTDSSQSNQLTEFLIAQLSKIHNQKDSNLSVLMTATSKESLNKLLAQSHLIEHFYHLSPPDKSTRRDFIEKYLVDKLECQIDFDIMDIANETEGYLYGDLETLGDRIYHEVLFSGSKRASKSNFETALKGFIPSNLRGIKLQKSSIGWSDIGGLTDAKTLMLETLEWPTKYAPIFANCPLRLRSGILLYGYPGCGKTLLASAVAGQCGLNFISIKGPEILNKYIGASEQSVRDLFERAQAAKPCILFFDEFDSIAPKRGHDSTGVTDRVVNQMLTQMDGAEGLDGVYVLAATSRPDLIDSALLRPGRLDKSVICDMPNFDDRLDILQTVTAKMNLTGDVNLNKIAEKTQGYSGADMQGLAYNAYLKAVHVKLENDEKAAGSQKLLGSDLKDHFEFLQLNSEKLKSQKLKPAERVQLLLQIKEVFKNSESGDSSVENDLENSDSAKDSAIVSISHSNFEESLKETKPSISATELKKLSGIYRQFVSDRDGNMPDGTPSSEIGGRTSLM